MGSGEWGVGNGEWEIMGNGEWMLLINFLTRDSYLYSLLPTPHSPFPTPYSPLPTPFDVSCAKTVTKFSVMVSK
ncbi:MAG: hypothetical protein DSM106950_13545 [Stigonema ocellatum SAG 48.90 = DSM 106950]|nr:hypothetical protein [Stigonema ocellatum SAG 48.90 = DSM 106950]